MVSSPLIIFLLALVFSKIVFISLYFQDFAISIKAFDGTHQVFVQSQPISHFSINATRFQAEANHIDTVNPPDPEPITITS